MNTAIRSSLALQFFAVGLAGSLHAQSLTDIGSSAPTPGANDISQLSTQGNKTAPDGLNYYTDNYSSQGNGEPGQTFTTGANASGYVLTSLALRTGGSGSYSGITTPQPYYLHIYSISGSTATLLQTYTSGNVAFNDGDWLKWTGLSVALSPSTTYAYSFGKASSTSGWESLAVATNKYAGEIALIKPNNGGVAYGGSHSFDAVFDVGLVLATTPSVTAVTLSPWTNVPAGVPMTFTASVAGALPLSYQWQFNNGSGFVNLSGASNNPLSFVAAVTNTGSYRLVLTNSYGAVTSAPVALAVSRGFTNIPASMPFPLPTYGMNIGNKLELSWGAPNPGVLYNAACSGFNAVRVPCAWNHNATTNVSGGVTNYPINASYMGQVKQTVDAAVASGMYVMINDHWDDGWLENNITNYVDPTINAKMKDYWTQIATTFAGYDNHLLFAAANEPNVHSQDEMKVLVYYYQTFVNAVRGAGGNNTNRWLVMQSVSDPTWMNALPTDTVTNRLMVEYHNYTPSLFSIIHSDQSWGTAIYYWGAAYHYTNPPSRSATWGEEYDTDAGYQQLADLYVSKGIPVLIGEFGASGVYLTDPTEAAYNAASVLYWDKYLAESARVHGLSPFYWSTGGSPFDYDTAANMNPALIAALTGGAAPPPPNGAPYAPSGLTATGGTSQITLSWTAGSGATSYNLYRATTSGGGSANSPIVTGITGTSYTNTGLANGTTYYYQVVAVNTSGVSGFSPEAKATTSGTSITDPAQFNFESTSQGWSGGGGVVSSIATSTAQKYAGNQSLAVNFNVITNGTGSPSVGNVAVTPGTTITFHVWIPSGSTITALQPYLMDNNWNWSSAWYGSFTPNAWNTLTLTVPANAASPLQVLGIQIMTSGAWTGACYIDSVSWPASGPDFSLAASPASLTVNSGTNGNSTVTVTAMNGLNACYTLSVSNLPSGVSATFTNNPNIGGQSLLTLTASNNVISGTTNVTVIATAGLISHTKTIALTLNGVTQPNTPPVLAAITNQTVNVAQTVAFTASATDTDSPPQILTFSLLAGPGTATLNSSSGAFSWTPQIGDAGTTNLFSIKVADNGTPSLSATQSFSVMVSAIPIKVTCVGDSITAGYGLASPSTQSYPAQLQTLLGSGYTVENDGASGSTVLKVSDNSFWSSPYSGWAYTNSMNSSPNIVVMMFGANDSKSWNWNAANFNSDYRALIAQYTNLPTHPKVFICYTPPMFLPTAFGTTFDPVFIENTVEPAIATIATQAGVQLIDNDTPLLNRPDLFQDGVHPTTTGAGIIAQRVANAINGLAPTNITSVAITSSGSPSVYGSPVTYTATLTSSAGMVTGAVVFAANNVPFSTNTLSSGTVSVTNSLVPIGANVVAAQYLSQGKFLGNTHSLQQIVTDPNGPTLSNLGGSAPVPGPNDISQLSTVGSQAWPDGLNYFTDNGAPAGQTFTMPAKTLNLVTVAIKTAGLNNGGNYGTPASTPTLYLRIYSMSGTNATLLQTFSAPNPGYTDGAWLRWSNFSLPLSASQTYAYSFGSKPDSGGWAALSVAAGNTYAGGEIALIPINGGTITNGSSHSFDATFVLGLISSNTPPVLAAITNRTVNVGQTVAFTASATDTDSPPQTLTFALLTGATNATLNTNSGAFSFRPLVSQANSTNNFTLSVSDNGTPSLSATQSFFVVVNPLSTPSVSSVSVSGGHFSLSIGGQSGPDYAVEASTNLTQWTSVFVTNSPSLPLVWTDTNSAGPQRFYRIKLGPPLP